MESGRLIDIYGDCSDEEEVPLNGPTGEEQRKLWDPFRTMPPKDTTGSLANAATVEAFSQIAKVIAYIVTFCIFLTGAVIAKGTLLFMTSQIKITDKKPDVQHPYCSTRAGREIEASVSMEERVGWVWAIFFCFVVPEMFMWFRSTRICLFRTWKKPTTGEFFIIATFETLHVIGLALLVYLVLPNLKVVEAVMLTNCVCLVPALLKFFSRFRDGTNEQTRPYLLTADGLAILAQLSGLFLWAALNWTATNNVVWILPFSLLFTSFGWWENYVDKDSPFVVIKYLGGIKENMKRTRYFSYMFLTIWKTAIFFICMLCIDWIFVGSVNHLFDYFYVSFHEHPYNVTEIKLPDQATRLTSSVAGSTGTAAQTETLIAWPYTASYVFCIQAGTALACFLAGKFACKIRIQGVGFALPINLTVPTTITLLITFCGLKMGNACYFSDVIPPHLFFECPDGGYLLDTLTNQHAWAWVFWIISQAWITSHNWTPKCGRLATTEKLFVYPFYNAFLVDQSMAMSRRRDDEVEVETEQLKQIDSTDVELSQKYGDDMMPSPTTNDSDSESDADSIEDRVRPTDHITRIYTCATMWHENAEETVTFLKSIFYLDDDQCSRRLAQQYLRVVDPDYYEIETHIFFDDAFELSDDDEDEMVVNSYVKMLIDCMDEAASFVHQTNIRIRPPKKYPTPYGGRLVWTLPGKTKIICHLKDKQKIRNRKRWSQVMYMYYLLGHKLMELPISVDRKAVIAQNTYLLALDGDIDFMPNAVQLLIDLMKRNSNLAAACGRIHPVGSGLMAWYQMFEYAIGHWLQKATEHMIGCVLCSPGCFSLFRGKCLMDDNVMAKYTTKSSEARHYVQYDQGEDRWLCTLLLQRGYRVEYCAASDAFTHCPEGFDEFYNQRRRWVPSTTANILDLLGDYKSVTKVNDNISFPYICYHIMLMIGTVIGPGTIFLMIVGSWSVAFHVDNWTSFWINLVPILFFIIICLTTKAKFQVFVAQIMSVAYSIVMMAVMVGIILQLSEDGWLSPSGIFLVFTASSFIVAALLHPQEFWCLPCGLVYYLTVPSMYLLLIIYSVCNLNNVSWGTREAPQKKKKSDSADAAAAAAMAAAQKKNKGNALLSFFQQTSGNKPEDEGSLEFSLAGLFKIMCCVHRKPDNGEKHQLLCISESLTALNKRLDTIERFINPNFSGPRKSFSRGGSTRGSVRGIPLSSSSGSAKVNDMEMNNLSAVNEMDDEEEYEDYSDDNSESSELAAMKEERDPLINPYWLEDKALVRGVVDFLTGGEIQFWKDMLEKYLYPIDEDKAEQAKIAAALKDLRNKSVFTFFILNALYVTIVFLMTLEKDKVHLDWPLGIQYNISYEYFDPPGWPTVNVEMTYLQLEPIGMVFLLMFASVMIIQFVAMFFHRFGTLSQIIATTDIKACSKKMEDVSDEAYLEKNAVKIAKELQQLKNADDNEEDPNSDRKDHVSRRRTIHNLQQSHKKTQFTGNLDAAFRKRIDSISANIDSNDPNVRNRTSVRRDTLHKLASRRSTIMNEVKRRSSVAFQAHDAMRSRRLSSMAMATNHENDFE
ncbi:hypothetical protein OUZ56_006685 [Daphnia magna]|uniref:chitin synthase n=1 Tax=Daphnia magna TaxID=35525 RepID=A0ABQ9YWD9_9CRUS|nr:hypothetical protein OUZ56_006685 [Daphnia magna]